MKKREHRDDLWPRFLESGGQDDCVRKRPIRSYSFQVSGDAGYETAGSNASCRKVGKLLRNTVASS